MAAALGKTKPHQKVCRSLETGRWYGKGSRCKAIKPGLATHFVIITGLSSWIYYVFSALAVTSLEPPGRRGLDAIRLTLQQV